MNKRERHVAIRELIESRTVASQEELRRLLRQRGWDVTQSTLSRDMRELRIARMPGPDGVQYAVTTATPAARQTPVTLDTLLAPLFVAVDGVAELAVVRTRTGGAHTVAEAIDGQAWPDVLGTIAGDNTILVICRSAAARERVARRLRGLARDNGG